MDRVDEIVVELLAKERSMEEIYKEFGISRYALNAINTGKKFPMEGFRYPIRKPNAHPIDPNSKSQKRRDRVVAENGEPAQTYTLHRPN